MFSSSSKVSVNSRYPASEPGALEGAFILRKGFHVSPTPISIPDVPPIVSSLHDQPSGRLVESTLRDQIPASLPVERMVGFAIEEAPGSTLVGSDGISNVALYGSTMSNDTACWSLSYLDCVTL